MARKNILYVFVMLQLLISFANAAVGECQPQPKLSVSPQWRNLKGIDIVPCPKKITVYDRSIPIDGKLAILIGKSASEKTKTAAADLQRIIRDKTSVNIPIIDDTETVGRKNLIIMGTSGELPQVQRGCKSAGISWKGVEEQGYAIFSDGDSNSLILAGKDEQGVYWAAMTLTYLIKDKKIRVARIVDWPDFKHRISDILKTPLRLLLQAKSEVRKKAAWQAVKAGIAEAARLKVNYVRSISPRFRGKPYYDYPVGFRARLLKEVGEYANDRGIKLLVNLQTVVGIKGDEKQFPELNHCLKFAQFYVSWSNDKLIDRNCEKITKMARIIGPQHYFFHSPDMPYMGWNRRSESDRKRWGNDRVAAETYLMNKIYAAMKKGCKNAEMSYVSSPYFIGYASDSPQYTELLKITKQLSSGLPEDISIIWREGSLESVEKLRQITKNRPEFYYIENSSMHKNRLLGGTARTAETFYFSNKDYFFPANAYSIFRMLKPEIYVVAEYAWNTRAPGAAFIHQNNNKSTNRYKRMTVDGIPWGEWMTVYDLDGPLRKELIPRACRLFFGEKVGDALALAYSVGGSINDNALGGWPTTPYDHRFKNSTVFAERLARATKEMAKLYGKPELFNAGTYPIYEIAFKYVYIYQYIEQVNAYLMRLSWIAETGKDEKLVPSLFADALASIKLAKKAIAAGYEKYHLDKIHYKAIYGARVGGLHNVYKKIDNLENAIKFKVKQIKMFGAGELPKNKKVTIGITSPPAAFKLDGKINEWDMASANVLDRSFYNRKLGQQGLSGPKDVITYWDAAWDKKYLYVAALVFDDKLSFPNDGTLFKNDAVELWVNDQQFIFSFKPDGKADVEPYGSYDKQKVKFAATVLKDGNKLHPEMQCWAIEIKIPIDCLRTKPETGNSFDLALGVDDVDPGEKPTQLVFPKTYKYRDTKTFAHVVLQPKAELTTKLISSKIQDVAKADGTYTCVNLELAFDSKKKTVGVSTELLIYCKDGIKRFEVDVPETLDGDWKKTMEVVTDDLYPDSGIDLVVRAPGYFRKFELRKGEYRDSGRGFIAGGDQTATGRDKPAKTGDVSLWTAAFDGGALDLHCANGNVIKPKSKTGCAIVDSRKGKAVKISGKGSLIYKLPKIEPINKGMLEFWLKPEYASNDGSVRVFINIVMSNGRIRFFKNHSYSYMFLISSAGKIYTVYVKPVKVKTDCWNYIALRWNSEKKSMTLNVNGVETTKNTVGFKFSRPFQSMVIGNVKQNGDQCCDSIIDELKIQKRR